MPVFIGGANSKHFQIASHLHRTLRLALLINEFRARVDEPVRVVIGSAIPTGILAKQRGVPKAMMDFLRRETYALSPEPFKSLDYGFEFEERYRI